MSADRFTLYAYNLVANTKIDEVPFVDLTYTETLSRQGTLSATLPAFIAQATDGTLEPGATALYVDDNDVLRMGGILWQHDLDAQQQTFRVGGEGHFSYLMDGPQGPRRTIDSRDGMTYALSTGAVNGVATEITFPNSSQGTPVDQFDIVADLLAHAYAVSPSGNLGFDGVRMFGPSAATAHPSFTGTTVSGNKSGVQWARTYWSTDQKGIGAAVAELSQSFPGFDWQVTYEWDTTSTPPVPRRYLDLYYPRKGQSRSSVALEHGGNVWMLTGNRSAMGMANTLRGVGAGIGPEALISLQQDPSVVYPAGIYPYLHGKYDANEEAVQQNLDARTYGRLAVTRLPINVFTVSVVSDVNYGLQLGDLVTGDTCRFTADIRGSGYMIDDWYRITQQTITVGSTGLSNWELQLVQDSPSTGVF